jgi:GAF domain-containing protein
MGPAAPYASCDALAATVGMDGVAVSLCGQPMYSSDEATAQLEDRQFVLGEGPLVAAFSLRRPIEAPDITDVRSHPWSYMDVQVAPIGAAFAYPMILAGACLGAVTLYRRRAGVLTGAQRAMLSLLADAAALETASLIVAARAGDREVPALHRIDELDQAVGVVMSQLRLDADVARARIRAHAFHADRPLGEVLLEIRAGRLRLAHH